MQTLMCKVENKNNVLGKLKVKVKAFKTTKFDGNVSFKEDSEYLVKGAHGADQYALNMCLSGDDDVMFERLQDNYGNDRKIVYLVISFLKCLRNISDGDTEAFIKMVDQDEQCSLDLKRVNLSDELNTANVVSHIERVLPSLLKRERVMIAEKMSTTRQLFPEWLKF